MNPVHPDPGLDEVTVYVFLPSQLEPKKFVWPLPSRWPRNAASTSRIPPFRPKRM